MQITSTKKLAGAAAAVMAVGMLSIAPVQAAPALEMSAGLSGSFDAKFGGSAGEDFSTRWLGGGFNAFFDAAYAEVGVGMTFASEHAYYDGDKINDDADAAKVDENLNHGLTVKVGAGFKF